MDGLIDFIKGFDTYAEPLSTNFEDGNVTYNDHGMYSERVNTNTLGHGVMKLKSKLAANIRAKVSRFANGSDNISNEGGQTESLFDDKPDELDE